MTDAKVTLKTSKKKMLLLTVGSGLFVFLGVWLLPDLEPVLAWGSIIFFGLCAIVGIVGLLPGSSYLELNPRGFLFCSLFRKWFVRWSDVELFIPIKIQFNSLVGWNYSSSYESESGVKDRKMSVALAGVEAALPDTYGMKAADLAALMNEWRVKHGLG